MRIQRTAAILIRHVYLLRGSPARSLPLFVWVAIDIVLWGFITRYLNTVAVPGFNFVTMLLSAILLWDFFTRVMHGVTMVFLEDVWSRNFLNLFATPLSISEYLSGLVLSSIITSTIGLLVMLAISTTVFGLNFFVYGLALIPFLLVLFLFGVTLGILGSAVVLRFGPAAEWFLWPAPAFLAPFSGVFYPISTLPRWMQSLSCALPPSYVFEGMRNIVLGRGMSLSPLLWSGGLAVLYVLVVCWYFSYIFRHAVRTGLIARYSAESLS